jgi:hypothetical protein
VRTDPAAEGRHRALVADRPLFEHVDAVGEIEREVHVLLGEQDGEALTLEPADLYAQVPDDQGREAFGGLIEQQQLGLPMSVRAMVSICCSPPERKPPGGRAARRSLGKSAYTRVQRERFFPARAWPRRGSPTR